MKHRTRNTEPRYSVYVINIDTNDMIGTKRGRKTLREAREIAMHMMRDTDVFDPECFVVCIDDNTLRETDEWQFAAYGYMDPDNLNERVMSVSDGDSGYKPAIRGYRQVQEGLNEEDGLYESRELFPDRRYNVEVIAIDGEMRGNGHLEDMFWTFDDDEYATVMDTVNEIIGQDDFDPQTYVVCVTDMKPEKEDGDNHPSRKYQLYGVADDDDFIDMWNAGTNPGRFPAENTTYIQLNDDAGFSMRAIRPLNEGRYGNLGKPLYDSMPSDSDDIRPLEISMDKVFDILENEFADYVVSEKDRHYQIGETDFYVSRRNQNCATLMFPFATNGAWKRGHKPTREEIVEYQRTIDREETKMQDLLHMIDNDTELYLETGWAGNCGAFADKITYSRAGNCELGKALDRTDYYQDFCTLWDILPKFRNIPNCHIIYYVFKPKRKASEISTEIRLDDIKNEIVDFCNSVFEANDINGTVSLQKGRLQYESGSDSYEAFVVEMNGYSNRQFAYSGSFVIKQNGFGDCEMEVRKPLSGSHRHSFDIENYREDVLYALKWITGKGLSMPTRQTHEEMNESKRVKKEKWKPLVAPRYIVCVQDIDTQELQYDDFCTYFEIDEIDKVNELVGAILRDPDFDRRNFVVSVDDNRAPKLGNNETREYPHTLYGFIDGNELLGRWEDKFEDECTTYIPVKETDMFPPDEDEQI